uniref:Integrase_SAM-like_N domain-containing protein n=1 Tax=Meloidogyne hapla TaxID=6305 RepID=A0A1I8BP16_MELHA
MNYTEWTIDKNCTICHVGANCIRPVKFKYPLLCVSDKIPIKNFNKFIENPPPPPEELLHIVYVGINKLRTYRGRVARRQHVNHVRANYGVTPPPSISMVTLPRSRY